MNPMKRYLKIIDVASSAGALAYGIYAKDIFWIVGGVLGFIVTAINLTDKVETIVKQKMVSRQNTRKPVDVSAI